MIIGAALALVAAVTTTGALLGVRLDQHSSSAPSAGAMVSAPTQGPGRTLGQVARPETAAVTPSTNVDDLPRAVDKKLEPASKNTVHPAGGAGGAVTVAEPRKAPSPESPHQVPPAGAAPAAQAPATAAPRALPPAAGSPAEPAGAPSEEPAIEIPNAPAPPVDPLLKAIKQAIEDEPAK